MHYLLKLNLTPITIELTFKLTSLVFCNTSLFTENDSDGINLRDNFMNKYDFFFVYLRKIKRMHH